MSSKKGGSEDLGAFPPGKDVYALKGLRERTRSSGPGPRACPGAVASST